MFIGHYELISVTMITASVVSAHAEKMASGSREAYVCKVEFSILKYD